MTRTVPPIEAESYRILRERADTSPLPPLYWFRQIPYQWGATTKALLFERDC